MIPASLTAKPLAPDEVAALVERLRIALFSRVRPWKAILVGSAARGTMTAYSDLDIVCVFSTRDEAKDGRRLLNGLSRSVAWPVDILIYDKDTFEKRAQIGGICFDAAIEGRELYAPVSVKERL